MKLSGRAITKYARLISELVFAIAALGIFRKRSTCLLVAVMLPVVLGGCGTALNRNMESTFLSSHDLIVMTDKMAVAIAANPQIAAITARGPMVIVLTNLQNMTDTIIPRGEGDIFLHRVRVLLEGEADLRRRFIFVLNRETFKELQARQGWSAAQLGPDIRRLQAQYALRAVFYSDTKVAPRYRSDYYLCTYLLTNIRTGQIIWEGSYEVKKAVHGSFLD